MRDIPVLETRRLILRAHRLDDVDACTAMWADPLVTKYIGGTPSTPQQTWARMRGYVGHWMLMGFGYWAIEERATGRFAGDVGFADFRREISPSMRDAPEAGWVLSPSVHGRGFASEAVAAAIAWGDRHLEAERTVCMIEPANAPSLRVAEKCGYGVFERALFSGDAVLFLERSRGATPAEPT